MFRPDPVIQRISLGPSTVCVIDDALLEPERWVAQAEARIDAFAEAPYNAFPGIEMRVPPPISSALAEYFDRYLRRDFGVRRTLRQHAKLAMVTRSEGALEPLQTIPHIDQLSVAAGECVIASVLYLFADDALGGTSFFTPRVDQQRLHDLIKAASELDATTFASRYGVARGYCADSTAWFERVLTVPPRWNRLIVYSGTVFHSGDIRHPQRLNADPRSGRLTLNAFLTCRRQLMA
ncbi:MAG: DUF6445 family protein [Pseudomonadota bacterium]